MVQYGDLSIDSLREESKDITCCKIFKCLKFNLLGLSDSQLGNVPYILYVSRGVFDQDVPLQHHSTCSMPVPDPISEWKLLVG